MRDYNYADNDYIAGGGGSAFHGATNAMIAIQALKARQRQEAIENALAMDKFQLERELQPGRMDLQKIQGEQARAAIGEHNARLADVERQRKLGVGAQRIGSAMVGAENYPNQETLANLVTAQREEAPGSVPQGQFDVQAPRVNQLGPTPQEAPAFGEELPQAPDYGPLIAKLLNSGRGGIEAMMRGNVASSPTASADALKFQAPGKYGSFDQFGQRKIAPPGITEEELMTIQQRTEEAKAKERGETFRGEQERWARVFGQLAGGAFPKASRIADIMKLFQEGVPKTPTTGQPSIPPLPGGPVQGFAPPSGGGPETIENFALRALDRGVSLQEVRRVYKEQTGKDLVLPTRPG